jgi:hypothetical protein
MISQPTPANADPAASENAADSAGAMNPVRRHAITEAAYYRAQQRDFEPGHEMDDWLAAEHEIMEREGAGTVG